MTWLECRKFYLKWIFNPVEEKQWTTEEKKTVKNVFLKIVYRSYKEIAN